MTAPAKPLTANEIAAIEKWAASYFSPPFQHMAHGYFLRLIATIEQQRGQIEKLLAKWQPIETAPRGMRVLIWVEDDEPDHVLAWTNDSGEMDEWPTGTTHWQPLLNGPNEALPSTEPVNDKR